MTSHWTPTATDLLTDKCFLIRRYFEQVEYIEELKSKMRKKLVKKMRYYELKVSAEFQLERIKTALKALGLPRVNLCKREICKCALNNFVAKAVINHGLR